MANYSPKEIFKSFREKDGDVKALYLLGSVALIAATASLTGITQTDESEDNNISQFDNQIAACAFNMLDNQATLSDAELAVSRCDTLGNLEDLQITIMGHQVLDAILD